MKNNLILAKMLTTMALDPTAAAPFKPALVGTLTHMLKNEPDLMALHVKTYAPGYDSIG